LTKKESQLCGSLFTRQPESGKRESAYSNGNFLKKVASFFFFFIIWPAIFKQMTRVV
jgi:hypothetical protein